MLQQLFLKLRPYLGSLLAAVVLLFVIMWGNSSGRNLAQAEAVSNAAVQAESALKYFYQDQDRFPTALEFDNQNIMLNYLSAFPLPDLPSKNCAHSFDYKRVADDNYVLGFCLPTSVKGLQAGWNAVNGTPATQ